MAKDYASLTLKAETVPFILNRVESMNWIFFHGWPNKMMWYQSSWRIRMAEIVIIIKDLASKVWCQVRIRNFTTCVSIQRLFVSRNRQFNLIKSLNRNLDGFGVVDQLFLLRATVEKLTRVETDSVRDNDQRLHCLSRKRILWVFVVNWEKI